MQKTEDALHTTSTTEPLSASMLPSSLLTSLLHPQSSSIVTDPLLSLLLLPNNKSQEDFLEAKQVITPVSFTETENYEDDEEDGLLSLESQDDAEVKKHQCPDCSKFYKSAYHLKRHVRSIHKGELQTCSYCGEKFFKKFLLRAHVLQEHASENAAALAASEITSTASTTTDESLVTNSSTNNNNCISQGIKQYFCPFEDCERSFPTEKRLKKHIKRHEVKNHVCMHENCGQVFSFRTDLVKHVRAEHDTTICSLCGKKLKSLEALRNHVNVVHKSKSVTFSCPYEGCLNSYNLKKNLNMHIRTVHEQSTETKWKCSMCNAHFGYKATLQRHFRNIHKKDKSFIDAELEKEEKRIKQMKQSPSQSSSQQSIPPSILTKEEEVDVDEIEFMERSELEEAMQTTASNEDLPSTLQSNSLDQFLEELFSDKKRKLDPKDGCVKDEEKEQEQSSMLLTACTTNSEEVDSSELSVQPTTKRRKYNTFLQTMLGHNNAEAIEEEYEEREPNNLQ